MTAPRPGGGAAADGGAPLPFVSIVVPVLNGGPGFADLLASLAGLDWPADRRELLVVDNGSTDDTAARAEAAGVTLLRESRRGAAHARNAGVARARGAIVAFTDADCVVTRGWLRGLVAPFADPGVAGTGGRTETFPPRTATERFAARHRHLDAERHLAHPTFPFAPTANAAFRRDVFERIGGFDPGFPWGEPVDFGKRVIRDDGRRLAYAPRGILFHRARPTVAAFRRQQWGYGYSLALLCAKFRDEVTWDRDRDRAADAEVAAALRRLLALPGTLVRRADGTRRDRVEDAWLDWVRLRARRDGFRAAVRERALVFHRGDAANERGLDAGAAGRRDAAGGR